jgi:phage gp46-like protein
MADITILWQPEQGFGDWVLLGPDLETGDDLVTAVLVSLFSDARAQDGDKVPDGSADRRGWWGDSFLAQPVGSRLWLIDRAKQTEATRLQAQDYAAEALAWLTAGGIAASIDVVASWLRPGWLGVVITLYQTNGVRRVIEFQWAWAALS